MSDATPIQSSAEFLSPQGQSRRDQMLVELSAQLRAVHHRRQVRRQLTASSLMFAIAAAIVSLLVATPSRIPVTNNGLVPIVASRTIISIITTDPGLVDRYRADAIPQVDWLSDETLLATLSEIGRPTGLIRSEGRVWLTQPVLEETPATRDHPASSG